MVRTNVWLDYASNVSRRESDKKLKKHDRDLEDKKQFETKLLAKRNRRFRRTKRHRKGNSEPGNGIVPPSQDISEILSVPVDSANNDNEDAAEVTPTNRLTGKVKNISSKQLSEHELEVIQLGPKFTPVQKDLDRAKLQRDLDKGFRRMKLADFHHPDEDTRDEEGKRFL